MQLAEAYGTRGAIYRGVTVPPFWWVRLLARGLPCSKIQIVSSQPDSA